ncbi:BMP family ABC transporter substrate-binding protein [Borrelia sp. A-FGy1]|uniref:BMP family ABC transporter substrate-binding protein n=1 Tax=Borrelia sp. A-FGy1 TaxID=2608247 RepID=UPI0017515394|nr:BMP family protein [Borrelia sp. A-FGy1]QMU99165.1 BMP family ABC transporter substrate-binding protein [Borrelia sp. A-FGy1]
MCKNLCFVILSSLLLISCTKSETSSSLSSGKKVIMGIVAETDFNDKGYFQSAFDGAMKVRDEFGIKLIKKVLTPYPIKGKENMTEDEALTKDIYDLQKEGANFIWMIGTRYSDLSIRFSYENPSIFYGIIDSFDYSASEIRVPKNSLGVRFRSQEGAFLAGYVAAKMSRRNKIGFLSGPKVEYVENFLVGFKAGAFYANPRAIVIAKRLFNIFDKSASKLVAKHMYVDDGVDVIFPVAGFASIGVFDAVKELGTGRYVIGINQDQSYLAAQNVITSVIKDIGKVIYNLSSYAIKNKRFEGGHVIEQGIKEGVIDIVKDPNIIGDKLVDDLVKLQNNIIEKKVIVPSTKYEFDLFKSKL